MVVGSGPSGLSAAARAAASGASHILLERAAHLSDTIHKYQKRKFVMATPDILPLRSDVGFEAGLREQVLGTWDAAVTSHGINIRHGAEVTAIAGERGSFEVTVNGGETIEADAVVLSIGLQGNLRRMEVPGAEWERVQYQLDDPDEYDGESIVVIGAGDAAIENAIALSNQNNVSIVNRRAEFSRAKTGNLAAITQAIETGAIQLYAESAPVSVEPGVDADTGRIVLKTPDGEANVACDRVIARLGATPPRAFLDACGISFLSDDPTALPSLSAKYESSVPGLYIIGALAGFPLIKQAMNQGYEVVETIGGREVEPADEAILQETLAAISGMSVSDALAAIQERAPLLSHMAPLQFREFMLDSTVHATQPGEVIFERNDFTNSVYSVVSGSVLVHINPDDASETVTLGPGAFFGEMGLVSGRRRTATISAGEAGILVETPRRAMLKMITSIPAAKRILDEAAMARQIQTDLVPRIDPKLLSEVVAGASLETFSAGETLITEGDDSGELYLIRSGSVIVARRIGGREVVMSYVPAGNFIGEMAVLSDAPRSATVKANVNTEAVKLNADVLRRLLQEEPSLRETIERSYQTRVIENVESESRPDTGDVVDFLVNQGLGEATDVLLIDESLCVRCDNCERACADTHDGVSRLMREAGPTYGSIHVPTSCRHCEHPKCMSDCPADAIHRAEGGEVYIDDKCIGCGNCSRDCPYGVIRMSYGAGKRGGFLSWLLFGSGRAPGDVAVLTKKPEGARETAVKCDMCKDLPGGSACVKACPTGAAIRVGPEEFFSIAQLTGTEG